MEVEKHRIYLGKEEYWVCSEVKLVMVLAIVRCVGELGESSILIATRNVTGKDRKIHLETTTEVQCKLRSRCKTKGMEREGERWILEIGLAELVNQINTGGTRENIPMPHHSFQLKILCY